MLFQRLNHQRLRIDEGVKTSSISSLEDRTIGRLRAKSCEVSRSMRADSFYQRCKTRVSREGNARPASSGEKFAGGLALIMNGRPLAELSAARVA